MVAIYCLQIYESTCFSQGMFLVWEWIARARAGPSAAAGLGFTRDGPGETTFLVASTHIPARG